MKKEYKQQLNKKCNICGGTGTDNRTLPPTECEECGGSGYIEDEDGK